MELASTSDMNLALAMHANRANEADSTMIVRFYMEAVKDDAASKAEGRPIFRDVPFVRISAPGDMTNAVVRRAWLDESKPKICDSLRWPKQWAMFRAGIDPDSKEAGTPLAQLPGITKAQVEEFAHFKVRTIEQLANISDEHLSKFRGGHAFRQRAQAWLDATAGNAPIEKMRNELEQRDSLIAKQSEALAALEARLAAIEAGAGEAPKRGPGRPPKQAQP